MRATLTALRAFESAARLLSFKAAAAELNLSPTAISHQIRALERRLNCRLFHRQARGVVLSHDGEELALALAPAFRNIDAAVERIARRGERAVVTLGTMPFFASRWLAPRLGSLWLAQPDIDLRLHHSPLPAHLQMERCDIAVSWGDGHWPGLCADPLIRVRLTPVHAPAAACVGDGIDAPEQLPGCPLLHYRDRSGWARWLAAAGVALPDELLPGTIFEDANVLLQAALAGQGVALGILPFIEDELASGRLLSPCALRVEPQQCYHLLYQPGALERDAVARVYHWLLSSAAR